MSDLVERLKRNAEWRNERWETITNPALLLEAAAEIESLRASLKRVQSAAKTIMIGEADELRRLREGAKEAHEAKQTLDSEREANARLTEELARTERNRDMWRGQCERQAGQMAGLKSGLDTENAAWAWLEKKFGTPDHDPVDRAYDASEMVDAFHAGAARTALSSYREMGS